MIPPIIYQDGHHISSSPTLPSLVIDMTSETVLGDEEEGDAAKDFLDASRILRGFVLPVHRQSSETLIQFPITGIQVW
jgi:hypothetical protein